MIVAGLVARFWVATAGGNFDFASYIVVVNLVEHGQNVYGGTERYNYGPVWFNVLHLLYVLASHNSYSFRGLLVALLSAVDIGIFWVLWRKFGRLAATLFFLNPVSIIITGFQNQFDNLAILLGLGATLLLGDTFDKPLDRRKLAGLVLLAVSLMTKHVLFAFPLWLAVKQKGWSQKCVVLILPAAIFLLSFAPYWPEGHAGIVKNVFLYKSNATAFLYNMVVPGALRHFLSPLVFWLLFLGLFAFVYRRKPALETLLLYTCVMVATAPATANQYLAIPSAFTSVFVNYFTIAYTATATWYLPSNVDGPHWLFPDVQESAALSIYTLTVALVWVTWGGNLLNFLKKCRKQAQLQPRLKD